MQDTSCLIVNHIRIMIEEAEYAETKLQVSLLDYLAIIKYRSS